jgi:hypothetical protein
MIVFIFLNNIFFYDFLDLFFKEEKTHRFEEIGGAGGSAEGG